MLLKPLPNVLKLSNLSLVTGLVTISVTNLTPNKMVFILEYAWPEIGDMR